MTWNKHKKEMEKALAAAMRLLVLIRESLTMQKAEESPLFSAVATHAQLCGTLLPDKLRMTADEVEKLRAQLKGAELPPPLTEEMVRQQLKDRGIAVVGPDGKGGLKVVV